ncbi:MAG: ABC transporter ATP-binding protein [Planctomycetes bacterium]|nr:ABC transporter ATP-binding protein [Planctomycetota bacterium]
MVSEPLETPGRPPTRPLSYRTIKKIFPYLWRRRWLILVTFLLTASYSGLMAVRNLLPAIWTDGVLLPESLDADSILNQKLAPVLKWFGLERDAPDGAWQKIPLKGEFLDLQLARYKACRETSGSPFSNSVRSKLDYTFEDGEALFVMLGPSASREPARIPYPKVPFTELSVKAPPEAFSKDSSGRIVSVRSGRLSLTCHPVRADWEILKLLVIFGLIVCFLITACDVGQKYLEQFVIQNILADLRQELIGHMTTLSMAFFNERSRGDLLSRVSNDLNQVSASLQLIFGDLIQKLMLFLVSAGALLYLEWRAALAVLAFYPFLFGYMLKSSHRVRRRSRKQSTKRGLMTVAVEQLFSGIRTVKSFSMEELEQEHFQEKNRDVVKQALRTTQARIFSLASIELFSNLALVVALGAGGYFIIRGLFGLSIGLLIAFVTMIQTMYLPVKTLAKAIATLQESMGSMERVMELFETRPTVVEATEARPLPPFQSSIRYDQVCFSYGREQVLKDISFEIPAGAMVAIVGPTGAGKSTVVDLLLRFYDPTGGKILIDGHDIRSVTMDSLISQVAIVSQDPFLFDTTIRNNIRYGRPGAGEDEIVAAAKAANIHDFIMSLPQGYDTPIGDRGVMLSGGQRQRVTIARSLLKNAPILILDEATSNLDSESEAAVQDALERLIKVRSTIAIAHRLSTIQHARSIIVIDQGEIAEQGSFEELMEKNGLFRRLYQRQFKDGNDGKEGKNGE